jgi:hypothetical protein
MMQTPVCILFGLLIECTAIAALSNDWRGIRPLHSTRSDVAKKLGVSPSGKDYDHFRMKTYSVYIRYTTERCEGNTQGDWDVPIGTVRAIDVLPMTRISLSTLNVDLSQFKASEVHDVDGAKIYADADSGFEFEYYEKNDAIVRLAYFPADKDAHLQCQKK